MTLGVGEHAAAADDAAAAVGAKGPGPDGATGESLPSVVSVNETLVAEGLCRADGRKDVAPPELRERLAAAQERARVDRAGCGSTATWTRTTKSRRSQSRARGGEGDEAMRRVRERNTNVFS